MKHKFKLYDKVRIIENCSGSRNHVGDEGIITSVNSMNYEVTVEYREGRKGNYHIESDLELVDKNPNYEIY